MSLLLRMNAPTNLGWTSTAFAISPYVITFPFGIFLSREYAFSSLPFSPCLNPFPIYNKKEYFIIGV